MEAQAADWGFWNLVFNAAALGLSGLAAAIAFWVKHKQVTQGQINDLKQEVEILKVRVESVPTEKAWGDFREALAGIKGDVSVTATEIRGLGKGLQRVEHHVGLLMEHELRSSGAKGAGG